MVGVSVVVGCSVVGSSIIVGCSVVGVSVVVGCSVGTVVGDVVGGAAVIMTSGSCGAVRL